MVRRREGVANVVNQSADNILVVAAVALGARRTLKTMGESIDRVTPSVALKELQVR